MNGYNGLNFEPLSISLYACKCFGSDLLWIQNHIYEPDLKCKGDPLYM